VKRFKDFYGSKSVVYAQLWEDLQMTNNAAARVAGSAKTLDKAFEYFMSSVNFLTVYESKRPLAVSCRLPAFRPSDVPRSHLQVQCEKCLALYEQKRARNGTGSDGDSEEEP
jgi:hypothetical protein